MGYLTTISSRSPTTAISLVAVVGAKSLTGSKGSGRVSGYPKQNVSSKRFAVVGISLSNHAMWCCLQVMRG
jgi:hypothetical protein